MFRKLLAIHALDGDRLIGWFSDGEARACSCTDLPFPAKEMRLVKKLGAQGAALAAEGYGIAWSENVGITADAFYAASEPCDPAHDRQTQLLADIVAARKQKAFSQAQLEGASGVRQPVIARMETGASSPRLDTIIKVLAPLGKTLAVVEWE